MGTALPRGLSGSFDATRLVREREREREREGDRERKRERQGWSDLFIFGATMVHLN